jgi:DNA-directed RNA polymerase specialized sigma subunit
LVAREDRAVRFYSYAAQERDKRIVALRQAGWTLGQIGADVGISKQGVSDALKRIAAGRPGRA